MKGGYNALYSARPTLRLTIPGNFEYLVAEISGE